MKIGCLGMATVDTLLFTTEPVYDHEAVTAVNEAIVSPGGKGIVSAAAIHRSGPEVLPFALVGTESKLRPGVAGLEDRYLLPVLSEDNRTWITVSEAHRVVTFVAHGELARGDELAAAEAVEELVREVDALYITIEHPRLLRTALDLAIERKLRIALNPSVPMIDLLSKADPTLFADLVLNCAMVLCNDWEAPRVLRVLGRSSWSELGSSALAEVVVTSGAAGGSFAERPFDRWEGFDATRVDRPRCVVGAGDTFNGAYMASRLSGATPAQSCRAGADLAAKKVAYRGSMLPIDESATAP